MDFGNQESYFEKEIKASQSGTEAKLFKIRKLREGLLASKRNDQFAIMIYEMSVDESFAQRNWQELIKSLTRLLDLYSAQQTPFARENEMKNYLIFYVACFDTSKSDWIPQMRKFNMPLDAPSVLFLRALNRDIDFDAIEILWPSLNDNEKMLVNCCFATLRPRLIQLLSKSYFTISKERLLSILLLDHTDQSLEILQNILPFGMDNNSETVQLKRRKK